MSYQHDISAWLQDSERKYSDGIQLLQANSRNAILARNLAARESEGNFQKLEYELQKLAEVEPVMRQLEESGFKLPPGTNVFIMQTAPTDAQGPAAPAEQPSEPAKPLSPEVQARVDEISIEAGKLYQEQARLSNTLADQSTDEQRKALVQQIEQVKDKRDVLAQERARLEAGGELAPAAAPQPTLADLQKKRDNLRSLVSKAKGKAEAAPTDAEKQTKFTKLRVELDQVELDYKHAKAQKPA